MPVKTQPTDIRSTSKYSLYEGYGHLEGKYSIIRYPQGYGDMMKYTTNWMTELQKDQLMELSDEDFDIACSKLDYS